MRRAISCQLGRASANARAAIPLALASRWSDAARASVPPGTLRAMVIFTGLDTLSEDGLDGDDHYVVHLWPGESIGVTVLHQRQGD